MKLGTTQVAELEGLVDASSLAEVLQTLASIARDKAEHIRTNWQDRQTAALWDRSAKRIDLALSRWPMDT